MGPDLNVASSSASRLSRGRAMYVMRICVCTIILSIIIWIIIINNSHDEYIYTIYIYMSVGGVDILCWRAKALLCAWQHRQARVEA